MASFRILVVEHDPDIRELLQEALEWEGHRVLAVRDGAEALGSPGVDLVILSVMTPVMNGLEYLMHRTRPHEPVVALGSSPLLLRQASDLGAVALLPRSPVTGAPPMESLLGIVSELLAQNRNPRASKSLSVQPAPVAVTSSNEMANASSLRRLASVLGPDAVRLRVGSRAGGEPEMECVEQVVGDHVGEDGPAGLRLLERAPLETSLASIVIAGGEALWFYNLSAIPFTAASCESSREGIRGWVSIPAGGASLELIWMRPRALSHLEARIALQFSRLMGAGASVPSGELLRLLELHALERSLTSKDIAA